MWAETSGGGVGGLLSAADWMLLLSREDEENAKVQLCLFVLFVILIDLNAFRASLCHSNINLFTRWGI